MVIKINNEVIYKKKIIPCCDRFGECLSHFNQTTNKIELLFGGYYDRFKVVYYCLFCGTKLDIEETIQ